jgi:pilus assembly protein CpaF
MELVFARDELADLDPPARRLALRSLVAGKDAGPDAVAELADAIDGFGRLSALMADDSVTDVLVNGPAQVWVERAGRLERTDVRFRSAAELRLLIERLIGDAGGRIDASEPLTSARLADGSRVHGALPPLAPDGPLLSIRRHPTPMPALADLEVRGTLTASEGRLLETAVRERRNIAVSGATGTGKTTLLNALLEFVGPGERVVTVEETPELRPRCAHAVALVARSANVEGRGAVGLQRLVVEALRMRPDRIVVGEVRGSEALAALAAMSTGHEGSMVTVHARSASEVVDRLAALGMRVASGLSQRSLVEETRRALDLVVFLRREGGHRRVAEIAEAAH